MIGKQLDLFGGPPMPPKKIRVEEEEPAQIPAEEVSNEPVSENKIDSSAEFPAAGEEQKVFVQMPGNSSVSQIITTGQSIPEPTENELPANGPDVTTPEEAEENIIALDSPEPGEIDDTETDSGFEVSVLQQETTYEEQDVADEVVFAAEDEETEEYDDRQMQEDILGDSIGAEEEQIVQTENRADLIPGIHEDPVMQETASADEPESDNAEDIEAISELSADNPIEGFTEKEETDRHLNEDGRQLSSSGLNIPEEKILYSRQYYTMRETAAMFNVNQSLLRFWENEFDILKPKKNRKGDRYFRPDDIRNLEMIYHLLRIRKFTIEGAKEYIKSRSRSLETFEMVQRLEKLKLFLQELKTAN
ncbi:MAG: MerR family transcriptional regulator [Chitinophagaceae bacterium]|nr:MerR family transcriptional regulator [Chitinophagaceae bacterium]